MKSLILILFISFSSHGKAPTATRAPEILDEKELSTKFVSVVQASKIEDTLIQSSEFAECAKKDEFKFDASKKRVDQEFSVDPQKATALADCFKQKIGNKSAEEIQKLSATLNLKGFQLIRSENVQEVTKFLTNRLYKKMTNIDLDEKDIKARIESLKFKNRKIVDQRDFVELYKIELGKSALYEISRFCFVNLRLKPTTTNTPPTDFMSHWGPNPATQIRMLNGKFDVSQVTSLSDEGIPKFGTFKARDKSAIYDEIKDSFSTNPQFKASDTKDFFENCMQTITPLCEEFRKNKSGVGANACLTQNRLQEIRKAMKNTTVVLKDFDDLNSGKSIEIKDQPAAYLRDNADTTMTSSDFLDAQNTLDEDKAKECATGGTGDECDGFLIQDDSYEKAIHNTDFNLRLKTELEKKNIERLKNDRASLIEYLEKNGYFELKEAFESNKLSDQALEQKVNDFFDGQRLAALKLIKDKVGARQVDTDETDKKVINDAIKLNVEASQEERGRLAQVVLFTNIVTSNLQLLRKGGGGQVKVIGKNTLGLSKEVGNNKQNPFFQNLQTSGAGGGGGSSSNGGQEILEDISFLDAVLGSTK